MSYFSSFLSNTTKLYTTLQNHDNTIKNDLLDPFTVIVNLALLSFKEKGTKIRLADKSVFLDDNFIFQSIYRSVTRQQKEDLKLLYEPIVEACKYFLLIHKQHNVKLIFECACRGLMKLKITYAKFDEIKRILNVYENIISKSLHNDENVDLILNNVIELSKSINENTDDMVLIKKNIYTKLNELWNDNRISMMVHSFNEMISNDKKDKSYVFTSIIANLQDIKIDTTNIINLVVK